MPWGHALFVVYHHPPLNHDREIPEAKGVKGGGGGHSYEQVFRSEISSVNEGGGVYCLLEGMVGIHCAVPTDRQKQEKGAVRPCHATTRRGHTDMPSDLLRRGTKSGNAHTHPCGWLGVGRCQSGPFFRPEAEGRVVILVVLQTWEPSGLQERVWWLFHPNSPRFPCQCWGVMFGKKTRFKVFVIFFWQSDVAQSPRDAQRSKMTLAGYQSKNIVPELSKPLHTPSSSGSTSRPRRGRPSSAPSARSATWVR